MQITLNKILLIILIFIAFIIVSTSVIVFSKPRPKTIVTAQAGTEIDNVPYSAYKNLGRIRIVTSSDKKNKNGSTLIIEPYFSYTLDDQEFYEELSRKNSIIKSIFVNYFSSHTKTQLKNLGEDNIKRQLQTLINEQLILNKIENIYFSDFTYLD